MVAELKGFMTLGLLPTDQLQLSSLQIIFQGLAIAGGHRACTLQYMTLKYPKWIREGKCRKKILQMV